MANRIKRPFKISHIQHYVRRWLGMKPKGKWFICMAEDILREPDEERGWPRVKGSYIVGFYSRKKDAISALERNACDIRECLYDYAILEYVREGVYGVDACIGNTFLYKWDNEKDGFFHCPNEEYKLQGVIGYGF